MKKSITTLILCSSFMFASEQTYVGLMLGNSTTKIKQKMKNHSENYDGGSYSLVLGSKNSTAETYLGYTYSDIDGDSNNMISLSVDFSLLNPRSFDILVGPTVGYSIIDFKGNDNQGVVYGGQLSFALTQSMFQFRVGYKYLVSDIGDSKFEIEHINGAFIGVNYFF